MGTRANMAMYGKPEYWDERYSKDTEPFDWYQRYDGIKSTMDRYVQPTHKVLMVGAGNSRLSQELYDHAQVKNITNIDISEVCINRMKTDHEDKQEMQWQKMDVTKLEFADGTFDVVLDKGTMDSVLCGEGSTKHCAKMMSEISRVLKPGGTYIVISYGQPDYRLNYFDKPEYNWNILPAQSVPKPTVTASEDQDPANVHYIYIMTKSCEEPGPPLLAADLRAS